MKYRINYLKTMLLFFAFILNIVIHPVIAFFSVLFVKYLIPFRSLREFWDQKLLSISMSWTLTNTFIFTKLGTLKPKVYGMENLKLGDERKLLILSNHQSWSDIFILHAVFHPHTSFLKFFLKKELIWIPFFGMIWKSLGFPFMKRYSRAYLEKYPERKNQDLETTKEFCEQIKNKPYAILNFVEGTRKTSIKLEKSTYKNLLPPKAGGLAMALYCLDYDFDLVIDVSIIYSNPHNSFFDLFCGRLGEVKVVLNTWPISEIPKGSYHQDPAFSARFQQWLNGRWQRKDLLIENILKGSLGERSYNKDLKSDTQDRSLLFDSGC